MKLSIVFLSVLFILYCAGLRADDVVMSGETLHGVKVKSIAEEKVTLDDGRSCEMDDITAISFPTIPLPEERSGVYLTDGTKLSGKLYAQANGAWIIRSSPFGILPLQLSKIAGVYLDSRKLPSREKIVPGLVTGKGELMPADVKLVNGLSVQYVTDKNVLAEEAFEQTKTIAAFRYALPKTPVLVRLTNGDELCGHVTFHGTVIHAEFNGISLREIPFCAVSEIIIQHQP